MQCAALARLQGQLNSHRAEVEVGRKQLREDLAGALSAQRQAFEAQLGAPLAGAFIGSCHSGTARPTAQFDSDRWEDHVRNTASMLQEMQTKTAELARLVAGQGDIDEALRSALAKHAAELAAQRSTLRDLGSELESKQGEVERGMISVKDGLEEVNSKVCELEGRFEVTQKSEFGLKGGEALSTFHKRTLYDELYYSILEELGDHVSRIRSHCERLWHDIHEAEQKTQHLNEQWDEAKRHSESWRERQERKLKELEASCRR